MGLRREKAKVDAALAQPVLKQELFRSPIFIESASCRGSATASFAASTSDHLSPQ
jgi:hypothetical protein